MTSDQEATRIMTEQRLTSAIAPGVILRQRYRLDSEIGRGGMGIVYRATDLELMREVAVKVLPETTSSSDARQRLMREARAAASLNHPHIISVHDVGEAEGMPFFVMELVHGPSWDWCIHVLKGIEPWPTSGSAGPSWTKLNEYAPQLWLFWRTQNQR